MTPRPDILLIVTDQMRGDALGLDGHPVLRTPVLDAIGQQGVHFTRAYSTCPSCIPARRSLLTGQYPATGGMVGFQAAPIRVPTLPQLLWKAGYATRLVGRHMHQTPYKAAYGYEEQILGSVYRPDDEYARFLARHAPSLGGIRGIGLSTNGWHARPWPVDEALHPTNWTTAQARQMLASYRARRPLFLTVSFFAPHPPLFPPVWYFDYYYRHPHLPSPAWGKWVRSEDLSSVGAPVDANRIRLTGEALRLAQAGFFGLIHHLDDQLYWLVEEFKYESQRKGRPWVVIFTSDHGEMLGDHGYFRKCEPYEGSARIPLLIQGSRSLGFSSGHRYPYPVCLEDLLPTVLDLAGIPTPPAVDGISLVSVLQGHAEPLRPWLHLEHAPCYDARQAFHALTDGRWKYVWRPHNGSEQLFDLRSDPREERDLTRQRAAAEGLARWRKRLLRRLAGRPEGFSDGRRLVAGCPYPALMKRPIHSENGPGGCVRPTRIRRRILPRQRDRAYGRRSGGEPMSSRDASQDLKPATPSP